MFPSHNEFSVEQQFHWNLQQQILATQLEIDMLRLIQRFQNCGGILPKPSNGLSTAWAFIPNELVCSVPWPLRKDSAPITAPPPTPASASAKGGTVGVPVPHVNTNPSAVQQSGQTNAPVSSEVNMPLPIQTAQLVYRTPSPSSDACSIVSGSDIRSSPRADDTALSQELNQMLVDNMQMLRSKGPRRTVKVLLERGVENVQSATTVATIIKAMRRELRSTLRSNEFYSQLRFGAMFMFRHHWNIDGPWKAALAEPINSSHVSLRGVNIAGLLGSLFTAGVVAAKDVHRCLDLLIESPVNFDRLCAMHALVVQANDKLCRSRSAPFIVRFRDKLSVQSPTTGHFVWGQTGPSRFFVADILSTVDRWFAAQTLKQAQLSPSLSETRKSEKRTE